jgi:hypothetical protein
MKFHMSALLSLSALAFNVAGRHASQLPIIKPNSLPQNRPICEVLGTLGGEVVRKN